MFKFFFILASILLGQLNFAQIKFSSGSSKILGSTGIAISDAFSPINNPATTSYDSTLIGIAIQRYYLQENLNEFVFGATKPFQFASVGFGFTYFGDELSNENQATVTIQKHLTETVSIGVGIVGDSRFAQYAERGSTLYPSLGISAKISEQFTIASAVKNPFRQAFDSPYQYNLQSQFSVGTNYTPTPYLAIQLQSDLWDRDGFSSACGLQYAPTQTNWQLLFGGRVHPGFVTAGIRVHIHATNFTVGSQYQNPLGFSPALIAETALQ